MTTPKEHPIDDALAAAGAPESRWPSQGEALAMLTEWADWSRQAEALQDSLAKVFGDFVESPHSDLLHGLFDAYTQQLAARLGDTLGWLNWFYIENDMGAKGMESGYDGQLKPAATLSDLLALIIEGRSRAP